MPLSFRRPLTTATKTVVTSVPVKPAAITKTVSKVTPPTPPPRTTSGFGSAAAGVSLGFGIPALTTLLPSITSLGTAGIAAAALPETISATGEAVSQVLTNNPVLSLGVVLIGAAALYRYI